MEEAVTTIERVELTREEKELYDKVFSVNLPYWGDDRFEIFEAAEKLTISLIDREVIPKHRREYFTKPEYQLGRSKRTWYQIFDDHNPGTSKFGHPNFIKFLKYFIDGADFPVSVRERCEQIVSRHSFYPEDAREELKDYLRSVYGKRGHLKKPTYFDENVFQLGLDLGLPLSSASRLRKEAMRF